ncbi:MAG: hypothetical protein HYZ54_10210 [Ignavibacteriae bacterium]|nr:hypothetical protein [Ignavibacteriota bacterium]
MKISRILFALFCITAIGISGCSTAPEDTEATVIPVSELNTSIGYSWFQAETTVYSTTVDTAKIRLIAAAFQANQQKMYVFVHPSCTCTGTQKTFPHTLEVLKLAGVPDSMIVVYSMQSSATKHPMMDRFSLGGLPSFFITKGTNTVYMMQTLNEKLYANVPSPVPVEAGSRSVEDMILDGFTK